MFLEDLRNLVCSRGLCVFGQIGEGAVELQKAWEWCSSYGPMCVI